MIFATKEQLANSPWKEAVQQSESCLCKEYSDWFSRQRADLPPDHEQALLLKLLHALCYLRIGDSGSRNNPFGGFLDLSEDEDRSYLPEALTEEQAQELFDFNYEVDDPELRARIADVIWLRKVGKLSYESAIIAVHAYVDSARGLAVEHPMSSACRFERAASIVMSLGKGAGKSFDYVFSSVEDVLDEYDAHNITAFPRRLLALLYNAGYGDPKRHMQKCRELGKKAVEQHKMLIYRAIVRLQKQFASVLGDKPAEDEASQLEAGSYVIEADNATSKMAEHTFLRQAVEAHRRIGDTKKAEQLHARLVEVGAEALTEMVPIEIEKPDTSAVSGECVKRVAGLSLLDALFAFCSLTSPSEPDKIKAEVIANAKVAPLSFIMGETRVNSEGKVVATMPSALGDDEEESILQRCYDGLKHHHKLEVEACILPAMNQIIQEHRLDEQFFFDIVSNHPFVPRGREMYFARGVEAGFGFDFELSMHFLVPQIESSLRYVLKQQGGVSSKLRTDKTQPEMGLDELLSHEVITKIFGDATVFNLRSILIEKNGYNIRHELAHGLLDYGHCISVPGIYLWWLLLNILLKPIAYALKASQQQEDDPKE